MKTNFGKIIKELREKEKLSQMELSKKLGITQSSLARYELEQTEPKLSDIKKICSFFGIKADYLVGLEDEDGTKIIINYNYSTQNGNNNFGEIK